MKSKRHMSKLEVFNIFDLKAKGKESKGKQIEKRWITY